jgi:hypothetical protein
MTADTVEAAVFTARTRVVVQTFSIFDASVSTQAQRPATERAAGDRQEQEQDGNIVPQLEAEKH